MSRIRFSIVITAYKQNQFICDAVDSALSQTVSDKEVIVVDDASEDGSAQILAKYGDAIHLACLKENIGAIGARNHGASLAKGDYIVFLDGDDAFMPWALEVYDRIIRDRNPILIYGRTRWINGSIPQVTSQDIPRKIEFAEYEAAVSKDRTLGLSASSFIVSRRAFQDVGGWTTGIFHLDLHDISLKLGCSGRTVLILSPRTVFYRIHTTNSIHSVPPFIQKVYLLKSREEAGIYPGGREYRFRRRAWLGGMTTFWVQRSLKAGLYKDALKLTISGWTFILAAVVRRTVAKIRGQRPLDTIEFIPMENESQMNVVENFSPGVSSTSK